MVDGRSGYAWSATAVAWAQAVPAWRRDGFRALPQPSRGLLSPPAAQHRLDHDVLRVQMNHPGHQLQMSRSRQIDLPHPHLPRIRRVGESCIRRDVLRKSPGQQPLSGSQPGNVSLVSHLPTSRNSPA